MVGEAIRGIAFWDKAKQADLVAGLGLAFLFAAFFRALVGATTFQSPDEVGFLIGASTALVIGLIAALLMAMPERLPVGVAVAMSGGALVDSLVAAIIGRSSTVLLTLVFIVVGLTAMAAYFFWRGKWCLKSAFWKESRSAISGWPFPLAI